MIVENPVEKKVPVDAVASGSGSSSSPSPTPASTPGRSLSGNLHAAPYRDTEPNVGEASENDHLLVDMNPRPESSSAVVPATNANVPNEPPPAFQPYLAESFSIHNHDIVSHDPHLNSDGKSSPPPPILPILISNKPKGEALYRFLLSASKDLPSLRLGCKGRHTETKHRWVSSTDSQGRQTQRRESYTEHVTDFDFCIEVYPEHLVGMLAPEHHGEGAGEIPIHWSVADDEPAYRGKMVREYEIPAYTPFQHPEATLTAPSRKKASRKEAKHYTKWVERRRRLGYPPWLAEKDEAPGEDGSMHSFEEEECLRSSKTLRQWADEYCASEKYLKEFVYEKVLYGWNIAHLEQSIHSLIRNTAPYSGHLTVQFTPISSKIYIRPSNTLSRMLSNKWLKFLSIVLLIFPFVWLFKRFHKRGGGRWEVCGGAYPLKQWVPVAGEGPAGGVAQPGDEELPPYNPSASWTSTDTPSAMPIPHTSSSSSSSSSPLILPAHQPSSRFMHTTAGPKKLIGIKEGEWFRSWEGVILRAVNGKYQSEEPLRSRALMPAHFLDGYDEVQGRELIQV